jgi:integrase
LRSTTPAGKLRKAATHSGRKPQTKGRGEGSVYQRDDGRWVGAMSYVDPKDGRRRRKYLYAASERDARDRLIAEQAALLQGQPPRIGADTVGSFLLRWLEGRHDVRASTKKREEEYTRLHVLPTLGTRRLTQLIPRDLSDLYNVAYGKGLSQRSVFHLHSVLHRALEEAVRQDLISSNPARRVRTPKVDDKPVAFLTDLEATRFMDDLNSARRVGVISPEQMSIFGLALMTGARQGELLALREQDIDREKGLITITRSVQLRKTIGNTKTKSSIRTVQVATDWLPRGPRNTKRRSDLLFPSPADPAIPLSAATLTDAFRRYMIWIELTKPGPKGTLVPKITFHGLRHTCATLLLAGAPEGIDGYGSMHGLAPNVVAGILGHSSTALLWRTYAHVIPPVDGYARHLMNAQTMQWQKERTQRYPVPRPPAS